MASIAAVAHECKIPNIQYRLGVDRSFYDNFSEFCLVVQGEVARIRIRQRGEHRPYTVLLTETTRIKIEHYVSRIRDVVDKSEMDADKKRKMNARLDQLANELKSHRMSFAKTMAILAGLTASLGAGVTVFADGPNAITHILELIGHDKESEETASKRLAPTVKALPAPARPPVAPQNRLRGSAKNDLDDDIPF